MGGLTRKTLQQFAVFWEVAIAFQKPKGTHKNSDAPWVNYRQRP